MPFANMSPDGSQEYFGDGIAEEILNVLVQVDELYVTSRTSSFAYRDKDMRIPDIAAELDVNYILEGSVRTAGGNVRVTAQLIDVTADRHLWSDTYDRNLSDIFAIQDEISLAIANALRVELVGGVIGEIPTENIAAYDLYLRGRKAANSPDAATVKGALDYYDQALALDPEFSSAWASKSMSLFYANCSFQLRL